jgi:hypothetical protein
MRFPTLIRDGAERPIVAVSIEADNGKRASADMLVDMGADLTLLPESAARLIDLDLSLITPVPVGSPLGPATTYRACSVVLELRRPPEVSRWRTVVGFVPRPLTYGILGTRGFFQFFNVVYHLSEHWLDIDPAGPLPQ